MNELVYPHERTLGAMTLIFGIVIWIALIVGTFGVALIVLAIGFILYLFIQSTLISSIKGNGVELSESQFPDLYSQFIACCKQLGMEKYPQAYILNGNGGLNAFATKFLGRPYIVLMSDIVDAMDKHVDGVRFYIGHELGHLRMKHLSRHLLRWPVLWLPLLGAAYSRACEITCDRHGLACSGSPESAARALAALSAGTERWKQLDIAAYINQTKHSSGFWMSFHELTSGYPWLTKRIARVMDVNAQIPKRNAFAYLLAVFIPYAGRLGGGFGILILIYIIGVIAAIAIPAYQEFTARAQFSAVIQESQGARHTLGEYYQGNHEVPGSLEKAGINPELNNGAHLSLDPTDMTLTVSTQKGEIIFTPRIDDQDNVVWNCRNGEGIRPTLLPLSCRSTENQ